MRLMLSPVMLTSDNAKALWMKKEESDDDICCDGLYSLTWFGELEGHLRLNQWKVSQLTAAWLLQGKKLRDSQNDKCPRRRRCILTHAVQSQQEIEQRHRGSIWWTNRNASRSNLPGKCLCSWRWDCDYLCPWRAPGGHPPAIEPAISWKWRLSSQLEEKARRSQEP